GGARIAVRIEWMAEARSVLASSEALSQDHVGVAAADGVEECLDARGRAAVTRPGQSRKPCDHCGTHARAGRGDDAGCEARWIELVICGQHERRADELGTAGIERESLSDLKVDRGG